MDPELSRTRIALQAVEAHLAKESDPEIGSYLVQHLAIIFYSELETKLIKLIEHRLSQFTDERFGKFMTSNIGKLTKRVKKSEIRDFISSFGNETLEEFDKRLTDIDITHYSNVILARHQIGHGPGVNINLLELSAAIVAGEKIISTIDDILG